MLWIQKYAPSTISEFAGNVEVAENVLKWGILWKNGKKQRPILLSGAPGVGKTTLAYVLAKQMNWDILETNASNLRDKDSLNKIIGQSVSCDTLSGKKKLVLIDEVDGVQKKDRGGIAAIYKIIKESCQPIILTANDSWAMNIRDLRSACTIFEMKKISAKTIEAIFNKIAKNENFEIGEVGKTIAAESEGDLRAAIMDFQAVFEGKKSVKKEEIYVLGKRIKEKDIFKAMQLIFKSKDYKNARSAIDGLDLEFEMLMQWIDENIPNEYEKNIDLAGAFNQLSRADVYMGRIHKQSWIFLKFAIDLATAGVALSKKEKYVKFTKYYFPEIIKKMSQMKENRIKEKEICSKISKKSHVSIKDAKWVYLTTVKLIGEKNIDSFTEICRYYEINEAEDIAFILGKKITDPDVEKVVEKIGKNEEKAKKIVEKKSEKPAQSLNQFF